MRNAETLADLAKFLRVSVGKLRLGEEDIEGTVASAPINDISLPERFRDLESRAQGPRVCHHPHRSRHYEQISSRRRHVHCGTVSTH